MANGLTGIDVLIICVLVISTVIGMLRGFVREAVALVFWVIGIWASWQFGPLIEPHLGGLLADPHVSPWIGRLAVLLIVILIGTGVGLLLRYFTRSVGLGLLDRGIGLIFGFARGLVLVGLMIIGAQLLHLNQESWWHRSKLVPYGETVGGWLRAMVGERGEPWNNFSRVTGINVNK